MGRDTGPLRYCGALTENSGWAQRFDLFDAAGGIAEAFDGSGFEAAAHQRGEVESGFGLRQFFGGGVQRGSAWQIDRAAVVEGLGGNLVSANLARQRQDFQLVIAR